MTNKELLLLAISQLSEDECEKLLKNAVGFNLVKSKVRYTYHSNEAINKELDIFLPKKYLEKTKRQYLSRGAKLISDSENKIVLDLNPQGEEELLIIDILQS